MDLQIGMPRGDAYFFKAILAWQRDIETAWIIRYQDQPDTSTEVDALTAEIQGYAKARLDN